MMRVVMGRDGEVDGQHGDGDDHPDDYPPAT
jgi:hypothetical protein